jgi:hypothetical protein
VMHEASIALVLFTDACARRARSVSTEQQSAGLRARRTSTWARARARARMGRAVVVRARTERWEGEARDLWLDVIFVLLSTFLSVSILVLLGYLAILRHF